jgi:hypothetical protein
METQLHLPTPASWRIDKVVTVTGRTRHRHRSAPISAGFSPPDPNKTLHFGPAALAASIARTATLRDAPPDMLVRWAQNALSQVEWLLRDGPEFELSPYIRSLADAERTSFAGRVGAGITDLLMNALGYTWRDNASCLASTLTPHADFIYGGGAVAEHGVVLAEAHGSFAAGVVSASIGREAKRKYLRQVRPHLSAISPHGTVVHGYSVAFGSKLGISGAFLHVAETLISKPRGGQRALSTQMSQIRDIEKVPTSLALSTYRSNLSLIDAPSIVRWVDWVRDGGERPDDTLPVGFIRIPYAGRNFLACVETGAAFGGCPDWLIDVWHPSWWPHLRRTRVRRLLGDECLGWFVMEEEAAERFLNTLSEIIRDGEDKRPGSLELARIDHVGFGVSGDVGMAESRDSDYSYALYADGLALLASPPPRRMDGYKTWLPREGMRPD